MTRSKETIASYVDASAAALSLKIEPSWRENVIGQLDILLANVDLVAAFELADEAEPATVFEARRDGD